MKSLIFDSGTLINLSMNGLLYIVEELKKNSEIRFFITHHVKKELVDHPINVPRFELGALLVQDLLDRKILELPEDIGISHSDVDKKMIEFMELANNSMKVNGKWIKIVSEAEMSCLALSSILSNMNFENIIAIDERTTRTLAEKPGDLKDIISKKLHTSVSFDKKDFHEFANFRFLRSTELVYVAYKKGLLSLKGPKALEAVLFATKFKGSSVSFEEINELKKL
ncbi:hypothetical protein HY450_00630 [Candidatus Pacearchaeota archaeon]|nr:hypothetical protein [Candidatus Pacearchaeota archaeon]